MESDTPSSVNRAPEPNESVRSGKTLEVGEHWRWCPRCGNELHNHRCKLVCPRCGYFMSCSDFD
jgi:ribosomal protein S27AE